MARDLFGTEQEGMLHTPRSMKDVATRQDEIGLSVYTLMEIRNMLAGTCESVANGLLVAQQLTQMSSNNRKSKRSQMSENGTAGYLWGVGGLIAQAHEKIDERGREAIRQMIEQTVTAMQGEHVYEQRTPTTRPYSALQAAIHDAVSSCLREVEQGTDGFIQAIHAIVSGRVEQAVQQWKQTQSRNEIQRRR